MTQVVGTMMKAFEGVSGVLPSWTQELYEQVGGENYTAQEEV